MKVSSLFAFYYPPEVSSMKYCRLGVFRKEYFSASLDSANRKYTLKTGKVG